MNQMLVGIGGVLTAMLLVPVGAAAQTTINHFKALAGNVTPGDTPGYPVTISRPGSYRLTSSLLVAENLGIEVTSGPVTIDLDGFSIFGNEPLLLGPGVSGGGSVTVRNGYTIMMGGGVHVGASSRVENVTVINNSHANGIVVGDFSIVTGCLVHHNGLGIDAARGALITDNIVSDNEGVGIIAGEGSAVIRNAVHNNFSTALQLGETAGYAHNVLTDNGGDEVQVDGGLQIGGNVCGTDTTCP